LSVVFIRPYQPEDRDAIYDICLRTGDSGEDASAQFQDPHLLGHVYAGPYLLLCPDLAFVLADEDGPAGYIIGTSDTVAFVAAYRRRWLPSLTASYPLPDHPPTNRQEQTLELLHHPERMLNPDVADYPAHLHIDLLPRAQGRGHGRALMTTFLNALRERGVPGVHLGVGAANLRAQAFYAKVGFHELHRDQHSLRFGMRL